MDGNLRAMISVRCVACVLLGAAALTSGCLSVYAPSIRTQHHHADLTRSDTADDCLSCHTVQRHSAHQAQPNADAPLVKDWMIDDERGSLHCHKLNGVE